ncbi:hypothetical protein ACLB2K_006202 [Fragaria x ananassa]
MPNPLCKRIVLLKYMILASKVGREKLTLRDGTHCGEAARAAAEIEILGQDGPSNLNLTILSSKDERVALEPVTDLLLPWIGSG